MKYSDENIPFDKCVKVLGWNSSRFDIALLWDALDCELWTICEPICDLNNTKSITVTHKKSHMKLQFIDAENLFGLMTLKACVKDYGDKSEHKDDIQSDYNNIFENYGNNCVVCGEIPFNSTFEEFLICGLKI
ncbi:MAG: hypothetical protein EZS28_010361 [Streblomastix strix]|uniref:Uncharacterized protein n=1 Tax=Streblomastix strix TaxID=222440 RepID=A0A5J4WGS7_9EUKA|nr:MAG: hypothetical protein EZS28_010361 [Streblomastix strix]